MGISKPSTGSPGPLLFLGDTNAVQASLHERNKNLWYHSIATFTTTSNNTMRNLAFLLLASNAHAIPTALWTRTDKWEQTTCSDANVTDAKVLANVRWASADTNTSWKEAVAAWQAYKPGTTSAQLKFPAFISDFYGGPEGWDCQDPVSTPCSTTVQCADTKHPAGFLLLNSFSKLHDLSISAAMGDFTSTFAPQLKADDQSTLIKTILDVMAFGIGMASAGLWNIVIKDAAIFAGNNFGFAKDTFNSAISASFALGKDNTKSAKDSASVQNDLTSAMGALFDVWKKTQEDYLSEIFSGSNSTTIGMLESFIRDGMMNTLPVDINLSGMVNVVETIMFGQMIPIAWQVAPAAYTPFVLKTGDACSNTMPNTLNPYMTQETHDKAGVCWNGNQFYVLTVGTYRVDVQADTPGLPDSDPPFQLMAGATHDVLDGKNWGGITLEDIVISSYGGYLNNGNRNGYTVSLDDSAGGVDQLMWTGGVQTPGFFSLPVCTSLWNTLMNIAGSQVGKDNYPCGVVVEKTYPAT
ncbi:hypothetical protein CPAR01_14359 [Colletotrichum paranaense]|uniref:Uncharacterized protein n=1 Tax=Colletotrichum paranaense TaxID=1914294 RepID=A0ABQ9S1Z6_9PEZI|nr:uncharacterized protein CPAR01_14359 [Colletotrichum paranaense]KAK1522816.1 hypothetical protein CPAR01_14359 [Colletotrichum paranaense]